MNLYEILGCETTATQEEIKKAYKVKAMKYHPDRGGDIDKFKELQQAYDVLSDEDRKERYDLTGEVNEEPPYDPTGDVILLFNRLVDKYKNHPQIYTLDLIALAIDEVNEMKKGHTHYIAQFISEIEKKKQFIERITRKNGYNFIADSIQSQINDLLERKKIAERALSNLDKVVEVLKTFDYKVDPREQIITTSSYEGFHGTTSSFFSF